MYFGWSIRHRRKLITAIHALMVHWWSCPLASYREFKKLKMHTNIHLNFMNKFLFLYDD